MAGHSAGHIVGGPTDIMLPVRAFSSHHGALDMSGAHLATSRLKHDDHTRLRLSVGTPSL